jgi:hypothetical protein
MKVQLAFIRCPVVLLIIGIMLFLPAPAAANPVPRDQIYITNSSDIMLLLSLNFVTNLFLFTGIFLLVWGIWRKNVGKLDPDRNRFMLLVLAGVSIITFLGSLIDLALVYQPVMYNDRVLKFNGPSWAFAAFLIFLSIYFVSHYLVKIRRRVSILIGAGMVAANLASWNYLINSDDDPAFIPLLLLAILPLLLIIMYRWHLRVFSTMDSTAADIPSKAKESG